MGTAGGATSCSQCSGWFPITTLLLLLLVSGPTVVQVAKVPSVEEEVGPEELSPAPPAGPEGQGGVEVQAAGPVGLSSQEVACGTSKTSTPTVTEPFKFCLVS